MQLVFLLVYQLAFAQSTADVEKKDLPWEIYSNFWYAFTVQGEVQVREFNYQGNRLSLPNDLGMDRWMGLRFGVTKKLRNQFDLDFSLEGFVFRGTHTLPFDLYYNQVKIEGDQGVDISRSQFLRAQFGFTKQFELLETFSWGLSAGLVYDRLKFYVSGKIAPDSPGTEIYENFGRQATPFPFIGGNTKVKVGKSSYVKVETSGTYIPRFTSWWKEGGLMDLKYSTFGLNVNYHQKVQSFDISLSYQFRYIKIFEESTEDTNDFELSGSGLNTGVTYKF